MAVLVVSQKKGALLERCLRSLLSQSYKNFECFVFLNECDEKEAGVWRFKFPDIVFEYDKDNLLFCRPNNILIKKSKSDYVLCLNDDVELESGFLENALKPFFEEQNIGAVSGCLLRTDRTVIDSTGLFVSFAGRAKDRGYGRDISERFVYKRNIFGVNGAAALYKREMLESACFEGEYFDESFAFFYEDLDLAWRAHRLGWVSVYNPDALAYHARGASARNKRCRANFFYESLPAFFSLPSGLKIKLICNRYATIIKNDNLGMFLLRLPWILLFEICQFFSLLFFDIKALESLSGKFNFFRSALKKRRAIADKIKLYNELKTQSFNGHKGAAYNNKA